MSPASKLPSDHSDLLRPGEVGLHRHLLVEQHAHQQREWWRSAARRLPALGPKLRARPQRRAVGTDLLDIFGGVRVAAEQPRPWLAALAADLARHRTVRPRLLAAAILMIGSLRRLCPSCGRGLPELALGLTSELDSCGFPIHPCPRLASRRAGPQGYGGEERRQSIASRTMRAAGCGTLGNRQSG